MLKNDRYGQLVDEYVVSLTFCKIFGVELAYVLVKPQPAAYTLTPTPGYEVDVVDGRQAI